VISMYNTIGQMVQTKSMPANTNNPWVDISALKAGVYMLEVSSDKFRKTYKIVIQ